MIADTGAIACGHCKTSYSAEQFTDICEPVDGGAYAAMWLAIARAIGGGMTISARRCECCGEIIYTVKTNQLEDTPCQK